MQNVTGLMDSSDIAKVYSPYSAEQNSTNWDVYG